MGRARESNLVQASIFLDIYSQLNNASIEAYTGGASDVYSIHSPRILLGSASLLVAQSARSQSALPIYCASNMPPPGQLNLHSSSGNSNVDHAMIAEIKNIIKFFPIKSGFKFIDDPSPNAFAVPTSVLPGTEGTVYIGLNLINGEFNRPEYAGFGGVAVAGICAHECGHILQFGTGFMQSLAGSTAQLVELHADFLAGYYLGRSRAHSKEHVQIFAQSLFSKGDYNFNNQAHHGTPQQRVQAMDRGYDVGASNVDTSTAEKIGADFVRQI